MLNFFNDHRLVYKLGADPSGQTEQTESQKKAPEAAESQGTPEEIADRIAKKGTAMIDSSEARLRKLLAGISDPKTKKEHTEYVDDIVLQTTAAVEHMAKQGMAPPKILDKLGEYLAHFEKKLVLKIKVDKITTGSPVMKQLYENVKANTYGLSQEQLFLKINDIFEKEKNPDMALQLAQGEILKARMIEDYPETPAKPDGLVNFENRLGQKQMLQVMKLLNIDFFDSLNLSMDQLGQFRSFRSALYRFDGTTYMEMGLLDANGNVQKEGVDKLLSYEKKPEQDGPSEFEDFRCRFGRQSGLNLALQAKAKEKYGRPGKLPTITIDGRSFDLNEITAEHQKELERFSKVFEGDTSFDKLNEVDKRAKLPSTVQELLNFRFDEATGADSSAELNLPPEVKARLEAVGMKDPDIMVNRGRIRRIEFKYKNETIELTMGKHGWGDNYEPHLHIYNGHQALTSRKKIDLNNLTQELDDIHKYKKDNQTSIDKINLEYFDIEDPEKLNFSGIDPTMSLLRAKETYLGNLIQPKASNQKIPDSGDIEKLEKILPMILANAKALGINKGMSLMEAMLKIYQAPNRDELLSKNYDSTLSDMKQPESRHYSGVEPDYRYEFPSGTDRNDQVKASRESTNPEYLERKERMQKMKPGDEIEVTFEGKKYSFNLTGSFANYEYSFKVEGFESESDFKINNLNLLKRTPEEQLKHMLGTVWRRASMDSEKVLNGEERPQDAPKTLSIDRNFYKGSLSSHPYLQNLPLSNEQRQLLKSINKEDGIKLTMHTDKYGEVAYCEVRWQDANKTDYRLRSGSGDLWRLNSLAAKSSRTKYPFYDVKTQFVGARLKKLVKKSSA